MALVAHLGALVGEYHMRAFRELEWWMGGT